MPGDLLAPSLEPLGLVDYFKRLPDELMSKIFNHFGHPLNNCDFFKPRSKFDITTVKAIGLTCRRFRKNSLHLLVQRLTVTPNESSLKRLDEVSRCTEIFRGLRVLSIDLRYYSAFLAGDLRAFSAECYGQLLGRYHTFWSACEHAKWESMKEILESGEDIPSYSPDIHDRYLGGDYNKLLDSMSSEDAIHVVMELRRVLSAWRSFLEGSPGKQSAHLNEAALAFQEGHERYRARVKEQDRILRLGNFAQTVAAFASRSKSKVRLSMSDLLSTEVVHERFGEMLYDQVTKSDLDLLADPHHVVQFLMVQPQQWSLATYENAEEIRQSLLYEIPLAMRTSLDEDHLAGLAVHIGYPPRLNLKMSRADRRKLKGAMTGLETFTFIMAEPVGVIPAPQHSPGSPDVLHAYLLAVLSSQNIQELDLGLSPALRPNGDVFRFSIKPLLCSPNWHGLKRARLSYFEMDLKAVRKLAGMLDPGTSLRLQEISLTKGTWAKVLDCLRSTVGPDYSIMGPYGGSAHT